MLASSVFIGIEALRTKRERERERERTEQRRRRLSSVCGNIIGVQNIIVAH
jgi:hypothetical protein